MLSKQLHTIALTAYISVLCFRKIRCTATAVAQQTSGRVSHDALQRLLCNEQTQWSRQLWKRVKKFINAHPGGYLVIDDTVIGKATGSWKTEMTARLWSSSEKRYLYGQSVVVLLWTDGRTRVLLDIRFYVRGSGMTKLDLAQQMLRSANDRKLTPQAVLFDTWYASATMMKTIRTLGWHWVTKLKRNRCLDGVTRLEHRWRTTYGSTKATLAGGIEAFVAKDGTEFFATSLLHLKPREVKRAYRNRWMIEESIKLLKSEFGLQTCQARRIPTIRAHAFLCLIAFNHLEQFRVQHHLSTLYHIRSVLFNQPIPLQRPWNLDICSFA
jgi:putative transposase